MKLADRRHDAAPHLEHLARVRVDDEVQVALAIPDLHVGQAVPLLGQRQQAFRQEVQPRRPDGELVRLGPEQPALHADPVAEVEQLEDLEVERRQGVLPDVDLDPGTAVGDRQEIRLTERANGQDAAARDRFRPLGFELVVGLGSVGRDQLAHGVAAIETVGIDLDAELRELPQVQLSLGDLFVLR